MPCIRVKILGPTDHNPTRVHAVYGTARATVPYDYAISDEANADTAARILLARMYVCDRHTAMALNKWLRASDTNGWVYVADTGGNHVTLA
jgi:hypothetical protein